jgi:glycosyltransferase involved in cell wall biosynthesis
MNEAATITHMTSVHNRYDTRIFLKECCSLAKVEGYVVNLIVADGKGDEIRDHVHIYDVGLPNSRTHRLLKSTSMIFKKAVQLDSDIYHFHDPELIPAGLKLVKRNKQVIFDIHENIAEQIKQKSYLSPMFRSLLSRLFSAYEKRFINKFTLILAENSYAAYFDRFSANYTIVLNMPETDSLDEFVVDNRNSTELFYIGSITENRGIYLLLDALKIVSKQGVSFKMHFIGPCDDISVDMNEYGDIKNNIVFHGRLELKEGFRISKNCMIGFSILKPIGNYITSYSTKIFEYMAVKLPVITSNFPLYKNVVEKYHCGLCVNPLDPKEIAEAICYMIKNPDIAKSMGENGKRAIARHFNWGIEQDKLFAVYVNLLSMK